MSVVKEFNRHFRALEAALNIENTLVADAATNIEQLYASCEDPIFANRVRSYGLTRLQFLRNCAVKTSSLEINEIDLSDYVIEYIFHNLIVATSWRYGKMDIPKKHHWLPVSYTRVFSISSPKTEGVNSRRCNVKCISFSAEGDAIERNVNDLYFAHGCDSKGNGFYHLMMEYFFGRIESMQAEARDKRKKKTVNEDDIFPNVAIAAFFAVQSVRNPHPSTAQFSLRTISGIVNGLIKALEEIPEVYTNYIITQTKMAFTPFVPTRILNQSNGTRAMTFAMAPHRAFIITNRPVSREAAREIAFGSNRAVIRHARRSGSKIFGLNAGDLLHSGDIVNY